MKEKTFCVFRENKERKVSINISKILIKSLTFGKIFSFRQVFDKSLMNNFI
jgi:hypothetical protein